MSTTVPQKMTFDLMLKQVLFWLIHIGCLGIIWVGFSWTAAFMCLFMYVLRMFAITGAYHRYFSHRSYKTSRVFQFVLAYLGAMSVQKGPIWWASQHRHHHKHSDTEEDVHPPRIYGMWWAHVGWVVSTQFVDTRTELVKDLIKFPELRWVDKYHWIPPVTLIAGIFAMGYALQVYFPSLHVTSMQFFIWGFCISTTMLYHGTFAINSLAHVFGKTRFETGDDSKNSFLLALVTLGEGWHNNHHRFPGSERQGFYWWEIDMSHYILKALSWVGLVWDLREPPARIYDEAIERKAKLAAR